MIPILDLRTLTGPELVAALTRSSCVFVTGHGLSAEALAGVLDTGREFYALPEAEKALVQWPGEGPWAGWQPVYAGGPRAPLMERFEVRLTPGGQTAGLGPWGATFPHWPARPAGFAQAWTDVYAHLHGVASRVTTLVADGLDLPAADLPAWTTGQHSNLVLNHYLAQQTAPEPGRTRARPHTDIGGITLLWADAAPGGLEAFADGEWVPVAFPPDSLLVQAGDLLHRWSRGRLPANLHRVVNPPRTGPVGPRFSLVFFHHPDPDTWEGARSHILARQRGAAAEDAGAAGAAGAAQTSAAR